MLLVYRLRQQPQQALPLNWRTIMIYAGSRQGSFFITLVYYTYYVDWLLSSLRPQKPLKNYMSVSEFADLYTISPPVCLAVGKSTLSCFSPTLDKSTHTGWCLLMETIGVRAVYWMFYSNYSLRPAIAFNHYLFFL